MLLPSFIYFVIFICIVHELCGAMTALSYAKKEVLGKYTVHVHTTSVSTDSVRYEQITVLMQGVLHRLTATPSSAAQFNPLLTLSILYLPFSLLFPGLLHIR